MKGEPELVVVLRGADGVPVWRLLHFPPSCGSLYFLPGWNGPGWYLRAEEDLTRQWILDSSVEAAHAKVVAEMMIKEGVVASVDGGDLDRVRWSDAERDDPGVPAGEYPAVVLPRALELVGRRRWWQFWKR